MQPSNLTVSVVLCTFNGAQYLQEQLESLAAQTRLPDELVVADDGSTDGTADVLSRFAVTAPFPVCMLAPSQRLGAGRNFERAMCAAEGDVVFPCDQDDVWRSEKIDRVLSAFVDPGVDLACCNADLVREDLSPMRGDLWTSLGFGTTARRSVQSGLALDVILRQPFATGMAMAVRKSVVEAAPAIPEGWLHDEWLSLHVAATGGRFALVPELLVSYRQHANNVVGASVSSRFDQIRRALAIPRDRYREFADRTVRAVSLLRGRVPSVVIAALEQRAGHYRKRAALADDRIARLPQVVAELATGRYDRFSLGLRSALRDAVAPAPRSRRGGS